VDVLELLGELARAVAAWHWTADGLCLEYVDDANWFPERGESCEPAKKICRQCLVAEECAAFAMTEGIHQGIWGGLSGMERRQLRAV
jgi:WhiB family redox-sensing transcriptional regulator